MDQKPWIDREKWEEVGEVKDHVTVVYDLDLGAIAGNWCDGELVATGADRSPLYPVNMPASVPLAVYIAHSHLSPEVRMPAVEWLLEHGAPVSAKLMSELEHWYKGVGEIP